LLFFVVYGAGFVVARKTSV